MGYGGELLYTAAMERLARHNHFIVYPAHKPLLSDIFSGRFYDGSYDADSSEILRGNKLFGHTEPRRKVKLVKKIDDLFLRLVTHRFIKRYYELLISRIVATSSKWTGRYYFHMDMELLSYAQSSTEHGIIWKNEPHAVDAILTGVPRNVRPTQAIDDPAGKIYLTAEEIFHARTILTEYSLHEGNFIVVEPHSNHDFFGLKREWPFQRWQDLIVHIKRSFPDIPIVQVGIGNTLLDGVVDLRGKLSFRQVGEVLRRCKVFLGTDGGLMHLSRAVGGCAILIWGCTSKPDFIGYPKHHAILVPYKDIKLCLNKLPCPDHQKCINRIEVDSVYRLFSILVEDFCPGIYFTDKI